MFRKTLDTHTQEVECEEQESSPASVRTSVEETRENVKTAEGEKLLPPIKRFDKTAIEAAFNRIKQEVRSNYMHNSDRPTDRLTGRILGTRANEKGNGNVGKQ